MTPGMDEAWDDPEGALDAPFFTPGGTLPLEAPSYVERRADRLLLDSLLHGTFCYVLTPRQMGKSSLMVRTAARLRAAGARAVVLDLNHIGHEAVTQEQWYYTLALQMAQRLGLRGELRALWRDDPNLGPLQRWTLAVEHVLNALPDERLVLFVDEIDQVRALPFSTDDFFAAIRAFHNRRPEDPALTRLTFCLLGVASPSDLIRDTRLTPFNIGRRIALDDFTPEEAAPLAEGLGREELLRDALLERILYWTGGHPYLTQKLCAAVAADASILTRADVDRLCAEMFLSSGAREHEDNLLFVRDRLLRSEVDAAGLLDLYARLLKGRPVRDEEADPRVGVLRLSGVARAEGGLLRLRNRIYARVFDRRWAREHVPGAELRRQRAAYYRGVLRAAGVAALILLPTLLLAGTALVQWRRANEERARAEDLLYAADMSGVAQAFERGEFGRAEALLEEHLPPPGQPDRRGFEWRYFWRRMHGDVRTFDPGTHYVSHSAAFSPDGRTLACASDDGGITLWETATGRRLRALPGHLGGAYTVAFCPTNARLLASGGVDHMVRLWDIGSGRLLAALQAHRGEVFSVVFSPDGRMVASGDLNGGLCLWDVASGRTLRHVETGEGGEPKLAFSPDGRTLACACFTVALWSVPALRRMAVLHHRGRLSYGAVAFSRDGSLAVGRLNGTVEVWPAGPTGPAVTVRAHTDDVNGLAFSPDGRTLATGSWDQTIGLWRVAARYERLRHGPRIERMARLVGHTNRITSVQFSPDGRWLASAGNGVVKLWDVRRNEPNPLRVRFVPARVVGHGYDHHRSFAGWRRGLPLLVTQPPGAVELWAPGGRASVLARAPVPPGYEGNATLSPDGRTVALGSRDGKVLLVDRASGQTRAEVRADTRLIEQVQVGAIAFSRDGNLLAVSSGDPAQATVWDLRARPIRRIAAFSHSNGPQGIAFSPDGRTLAVASWMGYVYLWDYGARPFGLSKREAVGWPVDGRNVGAVAFSPDGHTLATSSEDGSVRLWSVGAHRELVRWVVGTPRVYAVSFSPDGSALGAGLGDGTVMVWRAAEREGP